MREFVKRSLKQIKCPGKKFSKKRIMESIKKRISIKKDLL